MKFVFILNKGNYKTDTKDRMVSLGFEDNSISYK